MNASCFLPNCLGDTKQLILLRNETALIKKAPNSKYLLNQTFRSTRSSLNILVCVCVQTGETTELSSCCQLESLRSEEEEGAGNLETILAHLPTDSYSGLRFCVTVVSVFLKGTSEIE